MPAQLTFNTLQADIRAQIERGGASADPTVYAQIPFLINTVERQMARELKIQGLQNYVSSTMIATVTTYQKPDRWRENISLFITVSGSSTATSFTKAVYLRPLSREAAIQYWPTATAVGTPKFYTDFDYDNFSVVPTPQAAYPMSLGYWELPPLLDDTNQSNFWTEYAPNALYHGALREVWAFLGNSQKSAEWGQAYDRDMAGLSGEDLQKILDRFEERRTS